MKIIKHGNAIVFVCPKCGCMFSELPKVCYSSTGKNGAHYCMNCPECLTTCWATDKQKDPMWEIEHTNWENESRNG